jgi:hypothetical protein
MAMAYYKQRVVLVRAGQLGDLPSDLSGRHWIVVRKEDRRWRQQLADRLRNAGCAVKTEGREDWHISGTDLEEAGVTNPILATVVTPRATTPRGGPPIGENLERLRALFNLDIQRRVASHSEWITVDLTSEADEGNPWSEVPSDQLDEELQAMAEEGDIEIRSERGGLFTLRAR